jgi:hypothetical protein
MLGDDLEVRLEDWALFVVTPPLKKESARGREIPGV